MQRTQLYADPSGRFVHDLVLESACRYPEKLALVDASINRRLTYGEYGSLVETLARGLIAAGLKPGDFVGIFLPNSWEFCVAYHAATLAGGAPTLLNPSYRDREVHHQLENSGATFLISDGALLQGVHLDGLPALRRVYTTRTSHPGTASFSDLLQNHAASIPTPDSAPESTLAALPYSSGTTGLPKGVMLSHSNLVTNIYQLIGPNAVPLAHEEVMLCFLPLYHIYGMTVALNTMVALGATLVLMPRFNVPQLCQIVTAENVSMIPLVPPALNALCQAAEAGAFPKEHHVRWVKSGAAPLAPELPRRFTELTGIIVNQGYGMTEASPVTHVGYVAPPDLNRPSSIGRPLALTDCRVVDEYGNEVAHGQSGELAMRGPQFMMGYWKAPEASAAALRDGWYWSGDIVNRDADGFYYVLDRRKEMIKYKGFPVAPAEIEAVLLEHPAVRDCGVVAKADLAAGEIPCAFIVLRDPGAACESMDSSIRAFVAERLTSYKQPREVRFVEAVPRTASGKILRRELRKTLG
jgi:acyl-CoA synthetase (AMP-forming)/AMP-acid ligase II